jgi:hypothetical protein
MPPGQFKKPSRIGLLLAEGCNAVDGLATEFSGRDFFDVALYAEDLFDIGEIKVVIEGGTAPDPPAFQAAMSLFSATVLRGGKRLDSGRQYLAGG